MAAPSMPAPAVEPAAKNLTPASKEDVSLGDIALPFAAVKRVARSAAPQARFSREAIAGLHRVAQAFVCFATDRALHEATLEANKAKKMKGKANPTARKMLNVEHVMRFLTAEMPPIAKKVAALFPELMPAEFKPAGVRLLEQLQEQEKAEQAAACAATTGSAEERPPATLFAAWAGAPTAAGQPSQGAVGETLPPTHVGPTEAAATEAPTEALDKPGKRTRRGSSGPGTAATSATVEGTEPAAKKRPKAASTAPLTAFFARRTVDAGAAPPPEQRAAEVCQLPCTHRPPSVEPPLDSVPILEMMMEQMLDAEEMTPSG